MFLRAAVGYTDFKGGVNSCRNVLQLNRSLFVLFGVFMCARENARIREAILSAICVPLYVPSVYRSTNVSKLPRAPPPCQERKYERKMNERSEFLPQIAARRIFGTTGDVFAIDKYLAVSSYFGETWFFVPFEITFQPSWKLARALFSLPNAISGVCRNSGLDRPRT